MRGEAQECAHTAADFLLTTCNPSFLPPPQAAKETAASTAAAAQEKAAGAAQATKETAAAGTEAAAETAGRAAGTVQGAGQAAAEGAAGAAEAAKETTAGTAEAVQEKAAGVVESVRQVAAAASEKVGEMVQVGAGFKFSVCTGQAGLGMLGVAGRCLRVRSYPLTVGGVPVQCSSVGCWISIGWLSEVGRTDCEWLAPQQSAATTAPSTAERGCCVPVSLLMQAAKEKLGIAPEETVTEGAARKTGG